MCLNDAKLFFLSFILAHCYLFWSFRVSYSLFGEPKKTRTHNESVRNKGKMENGEMDFQESSFKFQTKSFIIHKYTNIATQLQIHIRQTIYNE